MIFHPLRTLPVALAAAVCCSPAFAADEDGNEYADHAVMPDRQLLSVLLPMNQAEVEVSQFAAERATSPAVKEFAQQMVAAHKRLSENLTRAARRANAHGTLTRDQRRRAEAPLRDDGVVTEDEAEEVAEEVQELREERAEIREEAAEERAELEAEAREELREAREEAAEEIREQRVNSVGDAVDEALRDVREAGREVEGEARELSAEARRAARRARANVREGAGNVARRADRALNADRRPRGQRGHGVEQLRREIADQATASVKEALARQSGKQFDMAYLSHQMHVHLYMLAAVDVAAEHAGPEMKTALENAHDEIEDHLKVNRDLAMKIDRMED